MAAATASTLAYFGLRALRWRALLPATAPKLSTARLYLVSAITIGFSVFTPAQIGEALKIELFSRNGGPGRILGSGAFLAERLVDALIIASIGALGIALYLPSAELKGAILAAGTMIVVIAAFAWMGLNTQWRGKLHELAIPLRILAGDRKALAKVMLLSLSSWSLVALSWLFCLRAVGIRVDFFQSVWLVGVIVVVQLATLMPGGIGISDFVAAKLLTNLGYAPDAALAGAIALRAYTLLVIALALTHLLYWRLSASYSKPILDTR
jgi:uncharacterized membrane protein YbhN (UPF0104 family)